MSTQYFSQGAIIGGTPYYYVKDRLGSVRDLVTALDTVVTQYSSTMSFWFGGLVVDREILTS
jgi:hypothetical protein